MEPLESRLLLASTTLGAVADTYICSRNVAGSNFGTSTTLRIRNDTLPSIGQTFLRYDLGGISGNISAAALTLTPLAIGPMPSPLTIRVRLLADADDRWIEGNGGSDNNPTSETTWYNRPAGTGNAVTFAASGLRLNTPFPIDVTSLVNQSINANAIASFVVDVVSPVGTQGYVTLASREWTAATRPTLTVTAESQATPVPGLRINDAQLNNLVSGLFADGALNRSDMIQVLKAAGSDDGIVDATELADLKYLVANAATFKMPIYVKVLSSDVVNGNVANAHYLGATLGNLASGSSAGKLNNLVDKWFYGTDRPASSFTYRSFAGSLFVDGPAYTDMNQGALGDCYYIAALGAIAKSNPAAIQNMFVDNGDGTWTVRFYYNGSADFVTVDRYLPSGGGYTVYHDVGGSCTNSGNELWLALAEKAYAQWNETGKEGRDGTNSYNSIEGGWMATVNRQVLGHNSSAYSLSSSARQILIDALVANKAVTIATRSANSDGLYGNHAYTVTGYDAAGDTFQLYNPWGSMHPRALSYAQLQADTSTFVIADTSGNTSFAASVGMPNAGQPLFSERPVRLIDEVGIE